MTATIGTVEPRHFGEVPGNGFVLPALFGIKPGKRADRIDEGKDRQVVLLGEPHEPQRLAISFGPGHAEIPPDIFIDVLAFIMADEHHLRVSPSLAKPPISAWSSPNARSPCSSMKSVKIMLDIIAQDRALRVPGDLHRLPGSQVGVDLPAELVELSLERFDLLPVPALADAFPVAELFEGPFYIQQCLFKIKFPFHENLHGAAQRPYGVDASDTQSNAAHLCKTCDPCLSLFVDFVTLKPEA